MRKAAAGSCCKILWTPVVCGLLALGMLFVATLALARACEGKPSCLLEGSLVTKISFTVTSLAPKGPVTRLQTLLESKKPSDFASQDGLVLWTLANYSWLDFVLNWVAGIEGSGINHYFVGCLDDSLLRELQKRRIPCVKLHADIGAEELEWGSDIFKERGRHKIKFIWTMLEDGLQPMFSDLDVTWLQNPISYLRHYSEADVLISLDLLHPSRFDGRLEPCPDVLGEALLGMQNVGIHLMRPGALPLVKAWGLNMSSSTEMEQTVFNEVILPGIRNAAPDNSSDFCTALENVTVGLLPSALFTNGHLFYRQGVSGWEDNQIPGVVAIHSTFVVGRNAKRHYMRERDLWQADLPERFESAGGFLTFDLNVPDTMLAASEPPANLTGRFLRKQEIQGHIHLMMHQLRQVGAAIAVSQSLGRELILPRLWCGLDYGWSEHNGRAAGTRPYQLPYQCPLGVALDIELWVAQAKKHLLPNFHEPNILENPAMASKGQVSIQPVSVADSVIESGRMLPGTSLQPCGRPLVEPCQTTVPANMTNVSLQHALAAFGNTSIIHLTDIGAIWGGFATKDAATSFQRATEGLVEPWCCTERNVRHPLHFDL